MPRHCGGGFVDLTFQRRQKLYRNGPNTFQHQKVKFFKKNDRHVWGFVQRPELKQGYAMFFIKHLAIH